MNIRLLSVTLTVAFVLGAVFGLYVPMMGHSTHGATCPFSLGVAALCAPMMHIEHWQGAVTAVLVEILMLTALCLLVFFTRHDLFDPDRGRYSLSYARARVSKRPLLFQELFSNGILHRKEPSYF